MLLRIDGEIIDIGDIENVKKAKTLEDISNADGDISYSFSIQDTTKHRRILGISTLTDSSFVLTVDCTLLNKEGITVSDGSVIIEDIEDGEIQLYFISGNSSAASILSDNLLEYEFFETPVSVTTTNIQASWDNDSGLVFPIINTGLQDNRVSNSTFETDDFHPFIYVKTLINKILSRSGIKLTGDILTDARYNSILFTTTSKEATQKQIEKRSVNAGKVTTTATTSGGDGDEDKITFTDITNRPYYSGSKDLYATGTSRFTADVKMDVVVECSLNLSATTPISTIYIYKNGAQLEIRYVRPSGWDTLLAIAQTLDSDTAFISFGDNEFLGQKLTITLEVGDYLEIYYLSNTGDPNVTGGYFKVTPIKFYDAMYETIMPDLPAVDFVYGLFALFNPVIEFDPITKTLDVNLFEKVKDRTPIDFSGYIKKIYRRNHTELVSSYGRSTILSYSEGSDEIGDYNNGNRVCYGCGEIVINHAGIKEDESIDFVFASSFIKGNNLLGGPALRLPFKEFEDFGDELTLSTVSSGGGGIAVFNTSSAHQLSVGDWVNIVCNIESYNGYGKVSNVVDNDSFSVVNLEYDGSTTGTITAAKVNTVISDQMYLVLHVPSLPIESVSSKASIFLNSSSYTTIGYAYFDKPYTGRDIDNVKTVLSFDQVSGPDFSGGVTMKMSYFRNFESILNNSPKCFAEAYIPEAVYREFKHKTPVRYNENVFYVNKITGYNGSHLPCEVELIKL